MYSALEVKEVGSAFNTVMALCGLSGECWTGSLQVIKKRNSNIISFLNSIYQIPENFLVKLKSVGKSILFV